MAPFDLESWLLAAATPLPIVQAGAAVLRRPALEIPPSLFGTPALTNLVELMVEAMRVAPGVGLAAPQIGVPLRVFVAEDAEERMVHVSAETRELRGRRPLPLTVVVNPKVAAASGDEALFFEGCLSVRGYAALVPRACVRHHVLDPLRQPLLERQLDMVIPRPAVGDSRIAKPVARGHLRVGPQQLVAPDGRAREKPVVRHVVVEHRVLRPQVIEVADVERIRRGAVE